MKKIKLVVVVGHSKKKKGAFNKCTNTSEYNLNDELSKAIIYEAEKRDIPYVLHYRLNGYAALPSEINKLAATHCICVHHNSSSDKKVNGTETLCWKNTKVSDIFAKLVNDEMVEAQGYKNRGVKKVTQGQNGGHVLRNTSMPCILLEPYFMSNDKAVLERDAKKTAKAVIDGLEDFIKAS